MEYAGSISYEIYILQALAFQICVETNLKRYFLIVLLLLSAAVCKYLDPVFGDLVLAVFDSFSAEKKNKNFGLRRFMSRSQQDVLSTAHHYHEHVGSEKDFDLKNYLSKDAITYGRIVMYYGSMAIVIVGYMLVISLGLYATAPIKTYNRQPVIAGLRFFILVGVPSAVLTLLVRTVRYLL
jgi:hypothetical protein